MKEERKVVFDLKKPISPSSAVSINKDIELWKYEQTHPKDDTKPMAFGTALHCILLEPEKFDEKIYVSNDAPINPRYDEPFGRGSKTYQSWLDSVREKVGDKTIITPQEHKSIQLIQEMYSGSIEQICRIGGADTIERERRVEWIDEETGHPCKGYIDAMCGDVIIDIKTASTLDDKTLLNKISEGYYVQAGAYAEAVKQVDGIKKPKVFLLFIRSDAPYSMRIVQVENESIEYGLAEFRKAIKHYRKCVKSGFNLHRGFEKMGISYWKKREIDAANGRL